MSAIFCNPFDATVVSSTAIHSGGVAANCLKDEMGLTWRSSATTSNIVIDLGSARTFDTVAITDTNLIAGSKVRFYAGTTTAATEYNVAYQNVPVGTYTGAPTMIFKVAPITYRYVKIMIDNATVPNGAGFTEVSRLVVGKSVVVEDGMDAEAEISLPDSGDTVEGRGYVYFNRGVVSPSIKTKASMVTEAQWRDEWYPFLASVGTTKPFLFSYNLESGFQHERMFGYMGTVGKSKHRVYDAMTVEVEVKGFRV